MEHGEVEVSAVARLEGIDIFLGVIRGHDLSEGLGSNTVIQGCQRAVSVAELIDHGGLEGFEGMV